MQYIQLQGDAMKTARVIYLPVRDLTIEIGSPIVQLTSSTGLRNQRKLRREKKGNSTGTNNKEMIGFWFEHSFLA